MREPNQIWLEQRGAALLLLLLAILLIFTVSMFSFFDPESKKLRLKQRTQESLSRAKEALIAYAITRYDQNPGVFAGLPCPDNAISVNSPEGVQEPNCGANNANAVGRLPWKTLNIGGLRDGSGECLWYAVSGHYKTNPNAPLLNEDSPGLLLQYAADGNTLLTPNTPDDRLVAVVFAPGQPLAGQNRNSINGTECGGDYNAPDFLEAVGQANNAVFSNTPYGLDEVAQGDESSEAVINDKIITITRDEIWNAIRNRNYPNHAAAGNAAYPADIFIEFTRQLAECIADFGHMHGGSDLRLPWAVPVDLGAPSDQLYSQQTNYKDSAGVFGGRFPFDISISMANAGYAQSANYPSPGTMFTEGRCTAFVDLSDPDESNPPLASHATFPLYRNLWNHWKDHVFYAVAEARAPGSTNPSQPCDVAAPFRCLTVNGVGDYAAIVMFAGSALAGQSRDTSPDLVDNKALTANYLEGGNAVTLDTEDGSGVYVNNPPDFNDILFCVDQNLNVAACP